MTVSDLLALASFAGLIFSAGFATGRIVERLLRNSKNNRR